MTINLPIESSSLLNIDMQEFTKRLTIAAQQLLRSMPSEQVKVQETQGEDWWRTYRVSEEIMSLTSPRRVEDVQMDDKQALLEALSEKYL